MTAGDEAFVKSNYRLYVSNGLGWYNTTLVNRTPRWDSGGEPGASYEIADSATPLIITARAIDSDNGSLINQSIVSDSAQYMATISNDSSVWTFTPKSADSIGVAVAAGNLTDSNGDFVYTFKWSDGISFVTKTTTISYSPAGGSGASAAGFLSALRWSLNNAGGEPNFTANAVVQDHNGGAYYQVATEENEDAAWILKYDEDGTYQWGRELGTYYLRPQDVMVDDNGDAIFVDALNVVGGDATSEDSIIIAVENMTATDGITLTAASTGDAELNFATTASTVTGTVDSGSGTDGAGTTLIDADIGVVFANNVGATTAIESMTIANSVQVDLDGATNAIESIVMTGGSTLEFDAAADQTYTGAITFAADDDGTIINANTDGELTITGAIGTATVAATEITLADGANTNFNNKI